MQKLPEEVIISGKVITDGMTLRSVCPIRIFQPAAATASAWFS